MSKQPTRDKGEARPAPHSLTRSLYGTPESEVIAAKHYLDNQHAESTRRAYQSDWQRFTDWCDARDLSALPASPETVTLFLSMEAESGRHPSTLRRRTAAIRLAHRFANHEPPTNSELVKATLRGIGRSLGVAARQKAPALAEHVRAMVDRIDMSTVAGARDRALLLLGFAGALRRSELVALQVDDLEEMRQGLRIHIRRSKTDQEGSGDVVPVIRGKTYCPVVAVNDWQERGGISKGHLFRRVFRGGRVGENGLSGYSVALIVKKYARQAGFDAETFAGHSLRSGFMTSAAMHRAGLFKMMEVSRHKDPKAVMTYVRRAEEFEDHAGDGLL